MLLLFIYSMSLLVTLCVFLITKDRWQRLMSFASFSNKVAVLLLLFAYIRKDANLFDVFFSYSLLNASGIIFLSYFLSREDLS